MRAHEAFNRSALSQFVNSTAGRVFRLAAGTGFLALGYANRHHPLGWVAMGWSAMPLSSGALDFCIISGVLGGPWSGEKIRQIGAAARDGTLPATGLPGPTSASPSSSASASAPASASMSPASTHSH